jgi:cyclopropane fatty-acyl-phospholipid synthase-like methyltransferase
MNFKTILATIFQQKKINIPETVAKRILDKNNVEPWFFYIFKERAQRWDVSLVCLWLSRKIASNSKILEVGCGCGWNLIWFGQHGFNKLFGSDINKNVLSAGEELAQYLNIQINFWQDDGLNPKKIPSELFDIIIALNWTHLLEDFDLYRFLMVYKKMLAPEGKIIIDIIDFKYNEVKNNQYLTSDWNKPEEERQTSEYKKRYSMEEVQKICNAGGFTIIKVISKFQVVPKKVYAIQLKKSIG